MRVGNINSYIACVYERGSTKPHSPQPLGIWVLPPVIISTHLKTQTLWHRKYLHHSRILTTIAALTGDEASTIEDYYEPYLLQLGLIERTPRGRLVTEKAKKHLNVVK